MTLLNLFISYFKIGMFSFGGGFAMLPLIEKEIIETHQWLTTAEFIDLIAISEMTPGPIAINAATFIGYRVSGIMGSIVATIAVSLPSFIVMSILMYFLSKYKDSPYISWALSGLKPIVVALIFSAGISVMKGAFIDVYSYIIAGVLFYLITFKKFNPILGLILAGIVGAIVY